jgi:hypothetical protein
LAIIKSFLGKRADWPAKALSYSGQLAAYRGARHTSAIDSKWIHFTTSRQDGFRLEDLVWSGSEMIEHQSYVLCLLGSKPSFRHQRILALRRKSADCEPIRPDAQNLHKSFSQLDYSMESI